MRIPLACVADAASISSDGKLYISGEFNCIYGKQVPVTWEEMVYVARIELEGTDPRKVTIRVSILDADMELAAPPLQVTLQVGPQDAGIVMSPPLVLNIRNAVFKEFGRYTVELRVDGTVLASTYIHIREIPVKPEGP